MSFDEEYRDAHGECRHEIHRLESQLKDQDAYIERLQSFYHDLRDALISAKNEIVASGNWGANDYNWPGVCAAIDDAIAKSESPTP